MLSRDQAKALIRSVLERAKKAGADEAELHLGAGRSALTRFANNEIHQNVASEVTEVSLRLVFGKRTARTSTTKLDAKGLDELVARTAEVAKLTPEDNELLPVLGPKDTPSSAEELFERAWSDATEHSTPEKRAASVKKVLDAVEKAGFSAAGYLSTDQGSTGDWGGTGTWIHATSKGLVRGFEKTRASFSMTVQGKDSSGWCEASSPDIDKLDLDKLGARAIEYCTLAANPVEVEPGAYDVILEPAAVHDLVEFLYWGGFTGRSYEEGDTWSAGLLGKKIFDEKITIRDDHKDPRNPGAPFDEEGWPREQLTVVEKGVLKALGWDRRSAAKWKKTPTGHGMRQPNLEGGAPMNLIVDGGTTSLEEMIQATKRGILIPHFWYNRLVDMKKVIVTGMTRDAFFLIEDGKITKGLKHMRFNQGVLDMLNKVVALGPVDPSFMVPAMKVTDFHFSSKTKF